MVLGDRLDHLGREAHHTERRGADLRVRHAELLELDLDQRRVGLGDAAFHHRVVATRRTAEHERGAEVVEQAGAERVVGLNADAARDRGRRGRGA